MKIHVFDVINDDLPWPHNSSFFYLEYFPAIASFLHFHKNQFFPVRNPSNWKKQNTFSPRSCDTRKNKINLKICYSSRGSAPINSESSINQSKTIIFLSIQNLYRNKASASKAKRTVRIT